MNPSSFAAIILAAGSSSRLGRFKPLLRVDGQTLIERAVSVFRQIVIEDIIVVTGHRAAELQSALSNEKVRIAHNELFERGMFSSVKVGTRHLPSHCEAFFVLPVDHAFVQPATVGRLIKAFRRHPGRICHPCVGSRRGHPPLIPARLAKAVVDYNGKGGLRRLLQRWDDLALEVTVADRGTLLDIDTPEDLLALKKSIRSA